MADQNKEPGRPGRRPKIEGKPKTSTMAFRVREGMREKLQVSADARSMSLSEEVERRLDLSLDMAPDPFKTIALRMITEQWKVIDVLTCNGLRGNDLYAYADAAKKAVDETIKLIAEPAFAAKVTSEGIKNFFGDVVRRERPEIDASLDRTDLSIVADSLGEGYAEAIEGSKMMDDIMAEDPPPKLSKAEREAEARAVADRKATFQGASLSPEEMTEHMGPPGRQYLPPKRRPKADP